MNHPDTLKKVLSALDGIKDGFNAKQSDGTKVSLADMIVLGGCAAIEAAATAAGSSISVPFTPGRMDASAEQTDVEAFEPLQPLADGFRNYVRPGLSVKAEELLIDTAQLLGLTAPEMTVLIGGMRALGANYGGSSDGVFTNTPGALTNDYFVNLLDMATVWEPMSDARERFNGRDRKTGEVRWTASRVDLVFGSNSELRAIAEVYASSDAKEKFVKDFVSSWTKIMEADRFDL